MVAGTWLALTIDRGWFSTLIGLVILVEVGWFLERAIRWSFIFFVLTSDRVMSREGIIAKRGIEIPLDRINTVMSDQGIFERLLGLGNLVIESASSDGEQRFSTIRRPTEVQKQIYVQMERNSNRRGEQLGQAVAGAAGANPVAADRAVDRRPGEQLAVAPRPGASHRGRVPGEEGRAPRPDVNLAARRSVAPSRAWVTPQDVPRG